jgi:hypothetical protein
VILNNYRRQSVHPHQRQVGTPARYDTLFVMVPLIEAINVMLPLFPKRTICLPAACTVNSTPFVLTSIT